MLFEMNFLQFINCSKTLRLHTRPVHLFSSIINRPVCGQRSDFWRIKAQTSHFSQYTRHHSASAWTIIPSKTLCTSCCCCTWTWGTSHSRSITGSDSWPNYTRFSQIETDLSNRMFMSSCEQVFVQKWRDFSSDATTVVSGDDDVENMEEIEWTHPTTRTESVISQDPELRSLLCEIAADFGKSDNREKRASDMSDWKNITDSESSESSTLNDIGAKGDGERGSSASMMPAEETGLEKETGTLNVTNIADESMFVFDIDELVEILREENAQDICVIKVPPEKNYVDYFVVVTGRSTRHLSAMTQFINKLYKQRKRSGDPFLIMEGKLSDDWMCLDFGNIVVHFMMEETRSLYDLEQLWTLGREFDDHIQQWEQHEMLMFNPKTDLEMQEQDDGESTR